jgi:hypothetical protein
MKEKHKKPLLTFPSKHAWEVNEPTSSVAQLKFAIGALRDLQKSKISETRSFSGFCFIARFMVKQNK